MRKRIKGKLFVYFDFEIFSLCTTSLHQYSLLTCAFNVVQCMYALRVGSDGNQILLLSFRLRQLSLPQEESPFSI